MSDINENESISIEEAFALTITLFKQVQKENEKLKKCIEIADESLCENIIDELHADIDWSTMDGETGLKKSLLNISAKNQHILENIRGAMEDIKDERS